MIIYNGNRFLKDDELKYFISGNIHIFKDGLKTKEIIEVAQDTCYCLPQSENEKIIYVDSLFDSNLYQNTWLDTTDKQIYIKGFVLLKIYNLKDFKPKLLGTFKDDLIFTITLTENSTFNDGEKHFKEPFVIHHSLWDLALIHKTNKTLYGQLVEIIRFYNDDTRWQIIERRRFFRLLPEFFEVQHIACGIIYLLGGSSIPDFMRKLSMIYPSLHKIEQHKTNCLIKPVLKNEYLHHEEINLPSAVVTIEENGFTNKEEESIFSKKVMKHLITKRRTANQKVFSNGLAEYFKSNPRCKIMPSFNEFLGFLIDNKEDLSFLHDITNEEILLIEGKNIKIALIQKAYNERLTKEIENLP